MIIGVSPNGSSYCAAHDVRFVAAFVAVLIGKLVKFAVNRDVAAGVVHISFEGQEGVCQAFGDTYLGHQEQAYLA
jgi:hypothetical protein